MRSARRIATRSSQLRRFAAMKSLLGTGVDIKGLAWT